MYPNLGIGAIGHKATLEESITFASKHGFRGIDFSIAEVQAMADEKGVESVRNLFDSNGVMAGVMGFPVEFRKDEETWQRDLESLPAQAKLAQVLGCKRTATWIPPGHNERNYTENFQFYVSRLTPAAAILADHGIAFGLEFIGPKTLRQSFKHRFIYTMDGMLAMAAAIGTGNVGLLLDIWHLYTAHGTNDDIRELSASEVVVVHINDAPPGIDVDSQLDQVRMLPGESEVLNIRGFLQALKDIGYDGPVTVEPFSKRVREMTVGDAVAETARSVQKVWPASGVKG